MFLGPEAPSGGARRRPDDVKHRPMSRRHATHVRVQVMLHAHSSPMHCRSTICYVRMIQLLWQFLHSNTSVSHHPSVSCVVQKVYYLYVVHKCTCIIMGKLKIKIFVPVGKNFSENTCVHRIKIVRAVKKGIKINTCYCQEKYFYH